MISCKYSLSFFFLLKEKRNKPACRQAGKFKDGMNAPRIRPCLPPLTRRWISIVWWMVWLAIISTKSSIFTEEVETYLGYNTRLCYYLFMPLLQNNVTGCC